jgi:hypothetical protein
LGIVPVIQIKKGLEKGSGRKVLMYYPEERRLKAEIERLAVEADKFPEGELRQELVDLIAEKNIEFQAED